MTKITLYSKDFPNDVRIILLNLPGKQAIEKLVLYKFHMVQTTMRATLVNHGRDMPMSLVHCHHLVKDLPKDNVFFMGFVLVPNEVPRRRG